MTTSTAPFRHLPVDLYSDEILLPTDLYTPDPRPPTQVLSDAKSKLTNVRGALQRGDYEGGLKSALEEPAYGEGVDDAKEISLQTILLLLSSIKSSDLASLLSSLSTEEQTTLMKYLYKVMGYVAEGGQEGVVGNTVLGWHEKLVEVAGTGCIVRVMTDYRRV